MSKKSRKRNKKILAAIGLGLGAMALSKRKKANANVEMGLPKSDMSNYENEGSLVPAKKKTTTTTVTTPTTVMDSMPPKVKKNPLSKRIKKNTNQVYTIKDGNTGVGNSKSDFTGEDGYIRRGENPTPMTPGFRGTARAASEMSRGMLPPQLRKPRTSSTFGSGNDGLSYMAKGGRVKGCGIAKRGLGRAMKKGKR